MIGTTLSGTAAVRICWALLCRTTEVFGKERIWFFQRCPFWSLLTICHKYLEAFLLAHLLTKCQSVFFHSASLSFHSLHRSFSRL